MTTFDLSAIEAQVAEGFINRQRHPDADLYIYNYTPRAQYDRYWTPETLACRGLILDGAGNVMARPFRKFFNYEEVAHEVPSEPFEVFEKMDGSLGITYFVDGDVRVATRGSFTSEQAKRAQRILADRYSRVVFDRSKTYLFEILYPENRIVVDYGSREDLVLLAMFDTESGTELPLEEIGIPLVERYEGIDDVAKLRDLETTNREGFVLRFRESGYRVKVKFEEYVRLHRLITGVNERHIWEYLREGTALEPLFERVPDEFNRWLRSTIDGLNGQFAQIEAACRAEFRDLGDRKATAMYFTQQCANPPVLFRMLDNKDYADVIWKQIRPEASRPFREDEE